MFRRIIPLALATIVSTGALSASAAGHSPHTAEGPCPDLDVDVDAGASEPPPESLPDSDELERDATSTRWRTT